MINGSTSIDASFTGLVHKMPLGGFAAGRYRCLEQPGRNEWCRVGRGFCLVRYGADSAYQGLRIVAGISRNGSFL